MNDEIEAFVKNMERAWNAGDYTSWGGSFAEDAHFVNIFGGHHHGRETITASHANIFKGVYSGSRNDLTVEQITPLAPHLYAVLVFTHLQHKAGVHDGRMSMILRETAGRLEIVWFHNTFVTKPAHHQGRQEGAVGTPDYKGPSH
jgi:uncharacterized protein (TIGR02246 family)